jgi:mycothiol synthase
VTDDAPAITITEDRDGEVLELDASLWTHDALSMALREVLSQTSPAVSLWLDHPSEEIDDLLGRLKFAPQRDLFRMERSIPLEQRTDLVTRSFVVGKDEEEWCEVNNRAFSWHREQGGWTPGLLRDRQQEPWFDPEGFRIYEHNNQIAAFCWTKIHPEQNPPVGEVYVIAVDPDFHGLGLGRALTLAGYQHLETVGITQAMLYVDADNTTAVNLYRDLGLEVQVVRRLYQQ